MNNNKRDATNRRNIIMHDYTIHGTWIYQMSQPLRGKYPKAGMATDQTHTSDASEFQRDNRPHALRLSSSRSDANCTFFPVGLHLPVILGNRFGARASANTALRCASITLCRLSLLTTYSVFTESYNNFCSSTAIISDSSCAFSFSATSFGIHRTSVSVSAARPNPWHTSFSVHPSFLGRTSCMTTMSGNSYVT